MPKRIDLRRRGKGKPKFTPSTFRSWGKASFPRKGSEGRIVDLLHDNIKSAPVMRVKFSEEEVVLSAPLGVRVGDTISIKQLKDLNEGTEISNIETIPLGGPKLARSGGAIAKIGTKDAGKVSVILPSKKVIILKPECRAITGIVSGGGRKEKPLMKAGTAYYAYRSKAKIWPKNAPSVRNPVDHPFGGGSRKAGHKKLTSKRASSGRKVGSIGAKRTGKRK